MTRTEIETILSTLAVDLDDDDSLTVFVDEVIRSLALSDDPPWCTADIKALTSGTSTYDYEDDMLQILYMIMHDEQLYRATEKGLEAYNEDWQSDTGKPTHFIVDNIDARQYQLYPEPDFSSDPLIPTHGQPWGEDWPDDSLALIYADYRETDILSIYTLPISFMALAQEFSYPSDHMDMEYAEICQGISTLLSTLTKVSNAERVLSITN